MDWHTKTIGTYDYSAKEIAKYFKGIGARVDDIEKAIELSGAKDKIRAIEIGCGDGRDAEEIIKRVGWYQGFDPSVGLLDIARSRLPNTSFVKSDALKYHYPNHLDIIFAFASLLHVNKEDMRLIFGKIYQALKPGGIVYISLKERPEYSEEVKKDNYGERMFYYYNVELIKEIAGSLSSVYEGHQTIGKTDWFTMALKKYSKN